MTPAPQRAGVFLACLTKQDYAPHAPPVLSLRSQLIRVAGPWAVAVALFFMAGGHWGALQAVAWAGMLWNYTQSDGSLLVGVQKTFDGKSPCKMCKSIQTAKDKERTEPMTVIAPKKIESFPAPLSAALPARECRGFVYLDCAGINPGLRAEAPPVPVPIPGRA
jgi:hypothetical protein